MVMSRSPAHAHPSLSLGRNDGNEQIDCSLPSLVAGWMVVRCLARPIFESYRAVPGEIEKNTSSHPNFSPRIKKDTSSRMMVMSKSTAHYHHFSPGSPDSCHGPPGRILSPRIKKDTSSRLNLRRYLRQSQKEYKQPPKSIA